MFPELVNVLSVEMAPAELSFPVNLLADVKCVL